MSEPPAGPLAGPLAGKVAAVTGAGRGLGRHVALRLAAAGARVALGARSGGELEAVAAEIAAAGGTAFACPLDVTRWPSVEAFTAEVARTLGPVEVLVANAGTGWYKPLVETSPEQIDATLDVNLKGLAYCCRAMLPAMLAAGRGQIVVIASDLARRPLAKMAPYVAAKHGARGFAASLLREVKDRGVRVMAVSPGLIDTSFGGNRSEGSIDEPWALPPARVAELVLHLLTLPPTVVVDELAVHPVGQDF